MARRFYIRVIALLLGAGVGYSAGAIAGEGYEGLKRLITCSTNRDNLLACLSLIGDGREYSAVEACPVIMDEYRAQMNHQFRSHLIYLLGELLDAESETSATADTISKCLLQIYNSSNSGPLERRRVLYLVAPYLKEDHLLSLAQDAAKGIPSEEVFSPLKVTPYKYNASVTSEIESYTDEWIRSRCAVMEALFSRGSTKCIQLGLSQTEAALGDDACESWRYLQEERRTLNAMVSTVAQAFALPLSKVRPTNGNMLYKLGNRDMDQYDEYLRDMKAYFAILASRADAEDGATITLNNLKSRHIYGVVPGLEECCLYYLGYSKRLNSKKWGFLRGGGRTVLLEWLSRNLDSISVDPESHKWVVGSSEPFPITKIVTNPKTRKQ